MKITNIIIETSELQSLGMEHYDVEITIETSGMLFENVRFIFTYDEIKGLDIERIKEKCADKFISNIEFMIKHKKT